MSIYLRKRFVAWKRAEKPLAIVQPDGFQAGRRTFSVRWNNHGRKVWFAALDRNGIDPASATEVERIEGLPDDDGRPHTLLSLSLSAPLDVLDRLAQLPCVERVTYGEAAIPRAGQGSGPEKIRPSGKPSKPSNRRPRDWTGQDNAALEHVSRPVLGYLPCGLIGGAQGTD